MRTLNTVSQSLLFFFRIKRVIELALIGFLHPVRELFDQCLVILIRCLEKHTTPTTVAGRQAGPVTEGSTLIVLVTGQTRLQNQCKKTVLSA